MSMKHEARFAGRVLDPKTVLGKYRVEDSVTEENRYLVKITDIQFHETKKEDYNCDIIMSYITGEEIFDVSYTFTGILTKGRNRFENCIKAYNAVKVSGMGTAFADITSLLGCYGYLYLDDSDNIKTLLPAEIKSKADSEMKELLDEYAEVTDKESYEVPDALRQYVMIPVYDRFEAGQTYHAVTFKSTCFRSIVKRDYDVKFSVEVFNGGHSSCFAKYFRQIHFKGKEEFTRFCRECGLVNDDGSLDFDAMDERIYCEVTLSEDMYGYLVIDKIRPIPLENDAVKSQYEMLLEKSL